MDKKKLIAELKECAVLFYQNWGNDAYKKMNALLPELNDVLQQLGGIPGYTETVTMVTGRFLNAFQKRDTLALADLFDNEFVRVITMAETERGNE